MSRPALAELLAHRSGHGHFAAYHRRLHHNLPPHDQRMRCRCGAPTAPAHFLSCRRLSARTRLFRYKGNTLRPGEILATEDGALAFAAWLKATREREGADPR